MEMATKIVQNVEVEDQAAEFDEFQAIEKLQELGINQGDIKKAKDAGYFTCESLLMNHSKKLAEIKGLSDAKIEKMLDACRKVCVKFGYITAKELDEIREREIVYISTGCAAVDEILGGGVETRAITEIFGEYRCGKTQICHTLAVMSQINTKMPGKCAYIDTEGTFRPKRIADIARHYNLTAEDVMDNVVCVRIHNTEHQMQTLEPLMALMVAEQYKLIIVDSVSAHFRTDYSGRGELSERQQRLGQYLSKLKRIAEEFNVAVFITNQVMSDPSGGAMFVSDPKKPVGGHVMAHAATVRLSVRKGKAAQRLVKVVQSPHMPEAEASFTIGNGGVVDYTD